MGANHAITEPPTWDATTPVVPDADADMDDATSVIEAFVTVLGKRTQWLRAAVLAIPTPPNLSDYARKSTTNTFTQPQTIPVLQGNTQVNGNMFATGDVHGHQVLSDSYVHAETDLEAEGKLVVTGADESTIDSDLTVGGTLRGGSIVASGGVLAETGDIGTVTGNVVAKSEFNYLGLRDRVTYVNMRLAQYLLTSTAELAVVSGWWWTGSEWASNAADTALMFPLMLPPGSVLSLVEVGYIRRFDADADAFTIERESGFPAPTVGAVSGGLTLVEDGAINVWREVSINPVPDVTVGDDERLTLKIVATRPDTRIGRIRLTWKESGVRPAT